MNIELEDKQVDLLLDILGWLIKFPYHFEDDKWRTMCDTYMDLERDKRTIE